MADNYFDPAATLGGDDPLRAWASQNIDPITGALIATDPSKAIDAMIAKGIAPPPHVMGYADAGGGDEGVTGTRPPTYPGEVFGGATQPPAPPTPSTPVPPLPTAAAPGSIIDRASKAITENFPIFGANGKMQGNQTSAQGQVPSSYNSDRSRSSQDLPPTALATGSALDPEENPSAGQPLVPRPRPVEAGPTDVSAKKKPEAADALSDFSKSLAGVKPIQPPPVNPVGTPSVRSPHAAGAPNIQTLLNMIGQQNSPTLSTLGRLLVAGKA